MVMVGVLAERHPEHVVLSNGVKIAVAEGLLPEGAEFGRSLTITYTIDGDEKRAEDIQLVPDWLTDWMDEHGRTARRGAAAGSGVREVDEQGRVIA